MNIKSVFYTDDGNFVAEIHIYLVRLFCDEDIFLLINYVLNSFNVLIRFKTS